MTTTSRKDFDAELAAWLYAELWLANIEAKAIKDVGSPAFKAKHEEINRIISRIEAL